MMEDSPGSIDDSIARLDGILFNGILFKQAIACGVSE